MPFTDERYFFYLFLKDHIERTHDIACRRADERFSQKPVREKIAEYLRTADIVIADCTGNNPNVLYELGIAHALEKDTILITRDPMDRVPSDIRLFEFLKYSQTGHDALLRKLDDAIRDILVGRYQRLFTTASDLLDRFKQQTGLPLEAVDRAEFIRRVEAAERGEGVPSPDDRVAFAAFALPSIIETSDQALIMGTINAWLERLRGAPA